MTKLKTPKLSAPKAPKLAAPKRKAFKPIAPVKPLALINTDNAPVKVSKGPVLVGTKPNKKKLSV